MELHPKSWKVVIIYNKLVYLIQFSYFLYLWGAAPALFEGSQISNHSQNYNKKNI